MKFSLANKFSPKETRGLDLPVLVSTDISWVCPIILCRHYGGTDCINVSVNSRILILSESALSKNYIMSASLMELCLEMLSEDLVPGG